MILSPNSQVRFLSGVILLVMSLSSCETKDPVPVIEQELITTLKITIQKKGSIEAPVTFTWKDADGSGPGVPVIDAIAIDAHSEYTFSLTLLNESVTPIEDITTQIEELGKEHQFFFSTPGVDGIVFSYDDTDSGGKPIGLENELISEHEGTGTFDVLLIHQPNKNGVGVPEGNPSNAGGETDLSISFPLVVIE